MNESEERFAAYLDAQQFDWSHEPDYKAELGLAVPPTTTPDFLLARGDRRAVAEVRQFETTHIRDRLAGSGGYASLSNQEVYGSLRSGMWEKAQQLSPLADLDVPLLIVLANPLGADVMLDAHHVQAAMWGNPGFVIPIDTRTGGPVEGGQAHWRLEDYGVFASPVVEDGKVVGWENRHPHISAVVVVHERPHARDWREEVMHRHPAEDASLAAAWEAALQAMEEINAAITRGEEPEGSYQWVTVYEVNGDQAAALPADWFDGPRDERYGFAEGGYGRLSPDPSQ